MGSGVGSRVGSGAGSSRAMLVGSGDAPSSMPYVLFAASARNGKRTATESRAKTKARARPVVFMVLQTTCHDVVA